MMEDWAQRERERESFHREIEICKRHKQRALTLPSNALASNISLQSAKLRDLVVEAVGEPTCGWGK